jgi:RNA polymerase sigma-32 factor
MAYIDDTQTKSANAAYIRGAMAEKMLSREDEAALLSAWLDTRDERALHTLINAHARLAVAAAHKFRHYGIPVADLIQEGMIGLITAANKFDATHQVRFATYAMWWVRSTIQDYILRNWSIVRTGTTAAQKSLFFNLRRLRARIDGAGRGNADDMRAEIAKTLNVNVREVEAMEQRLSGADPSLNVTVGEDSDDEWIALLADQRPNPEEIMLAMRDRAARSKWLDQALGALSDRERDIIRLRHLAEHGKTLEELGIHLGVSKERVRQIETRAMEKLRDRANLYAA